MLFAHTRAVFNKTLSDFRKLCFWLYIVVQSVFFVLYGYKIYENVGNFPYFYIYVALTALSTAGFVYYLATYKAVKKQSVRTTRRVFRISKYVVNAVMLAFVFWDNHTHQVGDVDKFMAVFSLVSWLLQFVTEVLRVVFEHYAQLFSVAFEQDCEVFANNPVTKTVQTVKNVFTDVKGTMLNIVDAIPKKIAQKRTPDEQSADEQTVATKSQTQLQVESLTQEFVEKKKAQKQAEKQKRRAEKQQRNKQKTQEFKQHLKEINPFKKNKNK